MLSLFDFPVYNWLGLRTIGIWNSRFGIDLHYRYSVLKQPALLNLTTAFKLCFNSPLFIKWNERFSYFFYFLWFPISYKLNKFFQSPLRSWIWENYKIFKIKNSCIFVWLILRIVYKTKICCNCWQYPKSALFKAAPA